MAAPLQKTKLFIPTARTGLVPRPRLLASLDGLRVPGCLTALISAPAGSGKTTLVVQWLARLGWPAGWLSLDERDNPPARFFAYLIAALQTIEPAVGAQEQTLLDLPGVDLDEVITLLVNDLTEFPQPFVLVLDDFHAISNPRLLRALDRFIEAQPPQMRLLLLARSDPAMQLARRRARGQLLELRQADLRFTLEESVFFLNQGMGLQLSTAQVKTLEARTEGWITGLQLAALSLQRAPDIGRFLDDFSGSNRFILDYLVEEVLSDQPPDLQSFLLETSILERMCAQLCAAVSGCSIPQAQTLLEQAASANLFVIPLDEERCWYRYHHLFRDLLQARLQSNGRLRVAELEQRASDWYEANGEHRLAVEYALQAGDAQRAADLIDRHISERWKTVDIEFHLLIDRLPFDVIAWRPSLCLQSAWLNVILGQTQRILPLVEAAERRLNDIARLPDPREDVLRAFARTLRAYLADLDNQPVPPGEPLEQALAAIPEANVGMRNSVAVVIGGLYFMEADFSAALRCFEEAIELDKRVNGTNAVPIASMRIAMLLQVLGRLSEAERRLSQAESYVRQRGVRRFYISGVINVILGDLLLEWNRLDEAEAHIQAGLHLLKDWPSPAALSQGLSLLARLHIARNDLADARAVLEKADVLRQQTHLHPIFLDAIERARVRLFAAEKNVPALEAWVRENQTLVQGELLFRLEARRIELCRAWLALDRSDEASAQLENLAAAAGERRGSQIAILALLAAAYNQEPDRAIPNLEEALHLAEPEGYIRTFVELGAPLQRVLKTWLQHSRSKVDSRLRDYAQLILEAFDAPSQAPRQDGLPEPLSSRELEVLQLVAQGLTNRQIADRLFISIRTVKKHVQNIHGKLGVQNRTQAAARGRETGLVHQ